MVEHTEDIILAATFIKEALGIDNVIIGIEDNKRMP